MISRLEVLAIEFCMKGAKGLQLRALKVDRSDLSYEPLILDRKNVPRS